MDKITPEALEDFCRENGCSYAHVEKLTDKEVRINYKLHKPINSGNNERALFGALTDLLPSDTGIHLAEVNPAESEIDRLANFILENMPEQIGKGNPQGGESAVDVAIRLLRIREEKP